LLFETAWDGVVFSWFMNILDIILILPILWGGWKGFHKGLIIEIFTLLAFGVGIWAGIHLSDFVSVELDKMGAGGKYLPVVAFVICFIAAGAGMYFLGKTIERMVKVVAMKPLDKLGGAVFGVAKFLMILSVVVVIFDSIHQRDEFLPTDLRENSLLYIPIRDVSTTVIPKLGNSELTGTISTASSFLPLENPKNKPEDDGEVGS